MGSSINWKRDLGGVIPRRLMSALQKLDDTQASKVEEIRVRAGQPLMVSLPHADGFLHSSGYLVVEGKADIIASSEDVNALVQAASGYSPYSVGEELKQGYITLPGGYRVGLAGQMLRQDGAVARLVKPTAVNIRIAREIRGAADSLLPYAVKGGKVRSLLIIGAPGTGKTTVLRALVRALSCGFGGFPGVNVSVIDERCEIASGHDLGPRADVVSACSKSEGMLLSLRALAPRVIATDELGRRDDITAVREAAHSGVSVIATLHAQDENDLGKRKAIAELINDGLFDAVAVLSRRNGPGTLDRVVEKNFMMPTGGR